MEKVMKLLLASGVIALFIILVLFNVRIDRKSAVTQIIVEDLHHLHHAFEKIHADCEILSFDHVKNPLTFLNVISFSGSEVGSMNLVHPEKWKGPYLKENPTITGIEYQLVRTRGGYFILPGDGTRLPNGKVVGTDIKIDIKTDVDALMLNPEKLRYKDVPLAVKLSLETPLQKALGLLPEEYVEGE